MKRLLHSSIVLISTTWTILLPLGIIITAKIIILVEPTLSPAPLMAIGVMGTLLTGGMLGIPLSYSLARTHHKMSLAKGALICLGWAIAIVTGLSLYLLISSTANQEAIENIPDTTKLMRSMIPGAMLFAGLMLIPGAIGGIFVGLVIRQSYPSGIAGLHTFSVAAAWSIALAIGTAIGYLNLLGLTIVFNDRLPTELFETGLSWIVVAVPFATMGVVSGAIGSIITFALKPKYTDGQ